MGQENFPMEMAFKWKSQGWTTVSTVRDGGWWRPDSARALM